MDLVLDSEGFTYVLDGRASRQPEFLLLDPTAMVMRTSRLSADVPEKMVVVDDMLRVHDSVQSQWLVPFSHRESVSGSQQWAGATTGRPLSSSERAFSGAVLESLGTWSAGDPETRLASHIVVSANTDRLIVALVGFRYWPRMRNVHGPFDSGEFKAGLGPQLDVLSNKSTAIYMDAFAKVGHIGMIYTTTSVLNTDNIVEAKSEALGTGIWSRTYRGDPDYGGVRRGGGCVWDGTCN